MDFGFGNGANSGLLVCCSVREIILIHPPVICHQQTKALPQQLLESRLGTGRH